MNGSETLLMLPVDLQAGLGFGTDSISRQGLLNNAVALAKTAAAFGVPVIATKSASKVYSRPLFPQVQAALPDVKAIERRNMNAWEDDTARGAVEATGRKRLLVAGHFGQVALGSTAAKAHRGECQASTIILLENQRGTISYSCRSAAIGSTFMARRAGIYEASSEVATRTRATAQMVAGSIAPTPKRR
jgi:hypothetical protein